MEKAGRNMGDIIFDEFDKATLGRLQQHYSIESVAKMYEVSQNTVRKWIRLQKIKAHKICGAVRIPKSELLRIVSDWTDY